MNYIDELKELFSAIPPKIEEAKAILSLQKLDADELARIAIDMTDNCFCEYREALNLESKEFSMDSLHSNYLLESLQVLLDHGLDPNTVVDDDENVLWNIPFIDAPNVGASALRLLLENGGNPNHLLPTYPETLFEDVAFSVSEDRYTHEWLHTVQCWLVLMAYGGQYRSGEIPLTMLGNNKVEIFKSFEDYDYTIEHLPQEGRTYGSWLMHIFRTADHTEVAQY